MTIGLVIDELTNQSTPVFESHLSLTDSFIIHKLTLIDVTILEVMSSTAVSLRILEVAFVILTIIVLLNILRSNNFLPIL
jgi:hypothetical protein